MSRLLEALHQALPTSRRISCDFQLTVDAVAEALLAAHYKVSFDPVVGFDDGDWDDERLEALIFEGLAEFHLGTLLIHTPACSRYGLEDFVCDAADMTRFIRDYNIEMFFDGDVLMLAPKSSTLTLFHHEGAFGHFRLKG